MSIGPDAGACGTRSEEVVDALRALTNSEQPDLGTASTKAAAFIEKLDAADQTAVTGQIDGTGLAAGGNSDADDDWIRGAVFKVHDDAIEYDGSLLHAKLDSSKRSGRTGDDDAIVIGGAID